MSSKQNINQKYKVETESIGNLLKLVDEKKIAIPDIQRPFVWRKPQVEDLLDSLYRGFPVGYIITWQNSEARSKDGKYKGKPLLNELAGECF